MVSAKADLSFPNASIGEDCRNDIVPTETMTNASENIPIGRLRLILNFFKGLFIE